MLRQSLLIIMQGAILWVIYYTGVIISEQFSLFLPGNIIGMILLLILLYTKILPLGWIERAGGFLIKHLALLFIPLFVGIAALQGFTMQTLFILFLVLLISALIGILAIGSSYQWLQRKEPDNDRRIP